MTEEIVLLRAKVIYRYDDGALAVRALSGFGEPEIMVTGENAIPEHRLKDEKVPDHRKTKRRNA